MNGLEIAGLAVFCVWLYIFIAVLVGHRFLLWRKSQCAKCTRDPTWHSNQYHATPAGFAGAFWPFMAPIMGGLMVSRIWSE